MPKVMPGYKTHAKQKIVREAEIIFSDKGYHQSTMSDVALAVGVSKATLYQYFANKEDLLVSVLERMTEERQAQMLDILQDRTIASVASREFFEEFLQRSKDAGKLAFDLLYEISRNDSIKRKIRDEYDDGLDRIVSFITTMKKRGVVRKDVDSRGVATGIIGLRDGLLTMSTLGIDEKLLKKTWQNWMAMVLKDILAQ
jgi:AcrR family transcriptional regulator